MRRIPLHEQRAGEVIKLDVEAQGTAEAQVTAVVRRASSLSAGARLCRAERGFPRAKADDAGENADLRSRP
jgi:hypothetical protein